MLLVLLVLLVVVAPRLALLAQFGARAEPVGFVLRHRKVYGTKADVQLKRKYFRLIFIYSATQPGQLANHLPGHPSLYLSI